MSTPDEVRLAYRLFLGREPENEDVINSFCQTTHSLLQLRQAFLKSPEFISQMNELLEQPKVIRHRHPFHLPLIPVETEVTNEILFEMFIRIREEWEFLGKNEPFWSVVTQPKYYKNEFNQHREQFYQSGNHATQLFLTAMRRCGLNPKDYQTCLEIGCGVGRVTAHLASYFEKVIAVDISQFHLDYAKNYFQEKNIHNIVMELWSSPERIEHMTKVDAIHSLITFQHNPPPVMAWMLKVTLDNLNPGGVAFIQIPTYKSGYLFEIQRYLNSPKQNSMEMHFLPQPIVFKLIGQANCSVLEVREDAMVGSEDKMLSNTFVIQKRK
jgi:SAM-dependent methyltransferase